MITVTKADIGRRVSAQWAGMPEPIYGTVTGVSNIPGYFFFKEDGKPQERKPEPTVFYKWAD